MSVWGSGASDLYVAGGAPSAGTLTHYDGARWSRVALDPAVLLLNWVHGFGPRDVTVVGNGGTVLHFDGDAWRAQVTGTRADLWGVWGAARDDLWAVGGDVTSGAPMMLHFDGAAWSTVSLPSLVRANVHALFKVWGSGPRDVFAVGQRGVVLHYDGAAWSEQFAGASDDLIAVWGTGPSQVVAVGGRGNGVVCVWNGSAWSAHELAPLPGLNGVWLRTPEVAHVVGITGTLARLDLRTFAYELTPVRTALDFHAVYGRPELGLTAVGGNFTGSGAPANLAYRRALGDHE